MKPKVRFDTVEFDFCDEHHVVKRKLTLVATLKGEQARNLVKVRKKGNGFTMRYDKGVMTFWSDEEVGRKSRKIEYPQP